ncbi:hypothetical protein CPU12_06300 [Malaciobacter molluscorum LMG 25693]|uniref:Uncharacterized protein n=1 Tax=Malaciobacter molluscorum LMG 25693 TaxID=870501 RepID=A0A2G1DIJ7_9BACT|nr:hypothetical protein [Malaciobacter molluscorum]AXX91926.1 hypothetical protein AMOL_0933 [Malaciobacter molluscorum LMG 25693]PHO18328.1 hypothetical protein CPU12_06300 [Malaciobacter molluscorum LMG 25693]
MGFIKTILKSFFKVSRPIFSMQEDILRFKVNSDYFYEVALENFEIKTRHDPYVIDAYTLKTKYIYLEHIKVDNDVVWNADALSIYENFLIEQLKLKHIKKVEHKKFNHYDFIIYEVDSVFIIPLIYIWEGSKDVFILDFESSLYKKLLSQMQKDYIFEFKNENILKVDFDSSLVKLNAFKSYFNISH